MQKGTDMKLRSEPKTQEHLLWEDARDEARMRVRTLTRRITDHIYVEIDKLYIEAQRSGQVITDVDVSDCISRVGPQVKRFLEEA
jgi:hypothetical protein